MDEEEYRRYAASLAQRIDRMTETEQLAMLCYDHWFEQEDATPAPRFIDLEDMRVDLKARAAAAEGLFLKSWRRQLDEASG